MIPTAHMRYVRRKIIEDDFSGTAVRLELVLQQLWCEPYENIYLFTLEFLIDRCRGEWRDIPIVDGPET